MSLVKRSTHGCPGGLPVLLLTACAVAASLAGVPAAAAEPSTLHDLAAAHGKYFGSATDNPELPDTAYAATLGSEFGQITPGNSMKWDTTEPQQGQFSFTKGDVISDFARDHGQTVRGHTLVWHSQLPGWVAALPASQVEAAMTNHITEVAGHYRGEVTAWDVVNEPFNDDGTFRASPFYNAMGSDYIATALRAAHAADPDAKLYINDYNTEGLGAKSDAMYDLVSELVAEGVPIDGVGFQGHLAVQYGFPGGMQQNLKRFADLGLDVAVTELDVRMQLPADAAKLATQATYYRNVVEACLAVARCVGITVWDYTDKYSWVPDAFPGQGAANLYDENLRPKASYDAVRTALGGDDEGGGGGEPGALKARYRNSDPAPADNQIKPALQLVNTGAAAVDLSTVKVRYWFTGDNGVSSYGTWCDWSPLGCSTITHRVAAMSSPKAGADHYLEVGFGSGSLAAGSSTGEIQLRLSKTDWSNFDETDDYSRTTGTSYADAPKVAVYIGGELAWGIEP
ncbi:endo-1,4-beta-xylanase [Streptomyces sp. ok210]|uniref:endo-1,4-beta-xylanase n=1 Tax=Streptomyces sp. ok210 TaxID=1761905 RepID=UPI0008E56D31|nr:endo-1,4-beta-xylanase [Streptomyces sp. ok210]SFS71084.1 endo-1,4-beta-xylanase [Streptomyces sp. ok210]